MLRVTVVVWKTLKLPIFPSARFPTELLSRDQHLVPCLVLCLKTDKGIAHDASTVTHDPWLFDLCSIIRIFLLLTQSFEHFYPPRSIIQIVPLSARSFKPSFFPLDYSDVPTRHSIIRTFLSSAWLIQIIPFSPGLFKSFLSPHDCSITLCFHHPNLLCSFYFYDGIRICFHRRVSFYSLCSLLWETMPHCSKTKFEVRKSESELQLAVNNCCNKSIILMT